MNIGLDLLVQLSQLARGLTERQRIEARCGGELSDAHRLSARLLEILWQFEQFGCPPAAIVAKCRAFATGDTGPLPDSIGLKESERNDNGRT